MHSIAFFKSKNGNYALKSFKKSPYKKFFFLRGGFIRRRGSIFRHPPLEGGFIRGGSIRGRGFIRGYTVV